MPNNACGAELGQYPLLKNGPRTMRRGSRNRHTNPTATPTLLLPQALAIQRGRECYPGAQSPLNGGSTGPERPSLTALIQSDSAAPTLP